MKRQRSILGFVALSVALTITTASTTHCGPENTGHERTSFRITVHGIRADATTSVGWHVVIDRAAIAMGPVRWYEGEPLFGQRWLGRFQFGVAEAHPGHYVPGEALADVTSQRAIDLLAPGGVDLETATGVTGDANSAAIELRAPSADLGPAGTILGGHTLTLRGVATRDTTTVHFDVSLDLDQIVNGIPAHAHIVVGPGRWDIGVDLVDFVDRADFSTLPAPSGTEYVVAPADGQVENALFRSATSGSPYRFTWIDDGRDI